MKKKPKSLRGFSFRLFYFTLLCPPSSFASCICLRMGENEEKITIEIQLVTVFVLRCFAMMVVHSIVGTWTDLTDGQTKL